MDIARAKLLMETIVEAGKHGPLYTKIASYAGEELKKLIEEHEAKVTPTYTPSPVPTEKPKPPLPNQVDEGDNWREKLAKERGETNIERKI